MNNNELKQVARELSEQIDWAADHDMPVLAWAYQKALDAVNAKLSEVTA